MTVQLGMIDCFTHYEKKKTRLYHKNFIKSVEMMGTVLHCAGETITLTAIYKQVVIYDKFVLVKIKKDNSD